MARLAEDGLCCCEYLNADGERSHLLASFCNCEALDLMFDRSALSMSTAYFLVVLSAVSGLVTVQQVVCIARGVKVRQWRRGRPAVASSASNSVQRASLALCRAARNCFRFWFRVKS
ncbi:hypothetical protein FHG87_024884 [Trinorchestia longiramus]|nr:hypothetical protein FHG87_024884 [Trinorchestia longiramus]